MSPGVSTPRGRLCQGCHMMRPAHLFSWGETQKYCSELCARRMLIPRPRFSRD